MKMETLKIYIDEQQHTIKTDDIPPHTTLNSYLRKNSNLTGTKVMCQEGGCGACVVAVTIKNPLTDLEEVLAVNSCLIPLYLCSGWRIHTPETIGDSQSGFHPVQKALVEFNGTQCGYCSSGMVMNMYALYESGSFTMKDVENAFGGNICRCTGYRPIMSAFKSLASDCSQDITGNYADIEDIPVCGKSKRKCQNSCRLPSVNSSKFFQFANSKWYKVEFINEILDIFEKYPEDSYTLISGNTATGVYKRIQEPDLFIDITNVVNLVNHSINKDHLLLGANMTLTNAIILFNKLSKEYNEFFYLSKLANHIDLIANIPVRNTGTLAGNLFIKHEHLEFPSDVYLILESVGAKLIIVGKDRKEATVTLEEFLSLNMRFKIIKSIVLPLLDQSYKYENYKIMPRAQNAHALVNAGFLFKLENNGNVKSARIVYGCINPTFTHARKSENILIGKNLFDNHTMQSLFASLEEELAPDHILPDPSPEFRKKLAIALCYKFILSIAPKNKLSPRNISGGEMLSRPISKGSQEYGTNRSLYPLTQPISKIEALAQCTGQAKYVMDMPDQPGQLYAAFVLAKAPPKSAITKINTSKAMGIPGVKAFFGEGDLPGENNFTPIEAFPGFFNRSEELFCSGIVKHFFQPVGIIVAESQEIAEKAANMVEVNYIEHKQKPLMSIRDIIATRSDDRVNQEYKKDAKNTGENVIHVIKGKFDISWQYHYTMETQCCVVIPTEDGLDIYPSTQSIMSTQASAAALLKLPYNNINVSVRRVGGAFGSKISRSLLVSNAAALAAYKLKKPVKLSMPLTENMNVIGKRNPFSMDYETGVDKNGKIQYMNARLFSDLGCEGGNENMSPLILNTFQHIYNQDPWDITICSTRTDCHTGTWCRAPATTESIAASETIMEHIASELNLDPIEVRLRNVIPKESLILEKYIKQLKEWAEVDKRKQEIEEFNKANRWVKKGISVVPMLYQCYYFGNWNVMISVYQWDGTVSIAHGGIEIGQGINTKVAQVCAHALGIPIKSINIKSSNTLTSPNVITTSGSITSEAVCLAVLNACEILKNRMEPIKAKLKNPSWTELTQECFKENIDLNVTSMFHPNLPNALPYPIYGVTCTEVEVDILTGVYNITRVDLLEDTGDCISPQIDIGQIEGAFVMGLGYWTCEEIKFNDKGELLTNRTWNYKPPGVKDIPIDFRVKFPENNPNSQGILNSKATGEPSLCMACSVAFAIRNAIGYARKDANNEAEKWYPIDGPSTVEHTFINSLHDYKQYAL